MQKNNIYKWLKPVFLFLLTRLYFDSWPGTTCCWRWSIISSMNYVNSEAFTALPWSSKWYIKGCTWIFCYASSKGTMSFPLFSIPFTLFLVIQSLSDSDQIPASQQMTENSFFNPWIKSQVHILASVIFLCKSLQSKMQLGVCGQNNWLICFSKSSAVTV